MVNVLLWILRLIMFPSLLLQAYKARKVHLWFYPLIIFAFLLAAEYNRYKYFTMIIGDRDSVMANACICMFSGMWLLAGWYGVYPKIVSGEFEKELEESEEA